MARNLSAHDVSNQNGRPSPRFTTTIRSLDRRLPRLGVDMRPVNDEGLTCPSYAANRWAKALVKVIFDAADTRTVSQWGRLAGASRATIGTWCRAACVSPRRSLELGRLLRGFRLTHGTARNLQHVMDVVEPRTIQRLLSRAGLEPQQFPIHTADLIQLLHAQRLIRDEIAVQTLQVLLQQADDHTIDRLQCDEQLFGPGHQLPRATMPIRAGS